MRNFGGVLSNFAPQGIHPVYSAPSPIVPTGKLYTTSTVLSSGEALKKNEFCIDFVQFRAGHCAPFCSRRGSPSFPADCLLPTATATATSPSLKPQAPSLKNLAPPFAPGGPLTPFAGREAPSPQGEGETRSVGVRSAQELFFTKGKFIRRIEPRFGSHLGTF